MTRLAEETEARLVFSGTASEMELTARLNKAAGRKGLDLGGRLGLMEFIHLIQCSPLLLCNNTGPVHLAAALNRPVIVLYARTNPQHTPWKCPNTVLEFDLPEDIKSRNEIIRYAARKAYPYPTNLLPETIVAEVKRYLHVKT